MLKRLYAARHVTDAHLVRGHLESCGIAATIRGEWLAGGIGELPLDACSLWVDEARFSEAEKVLRDLLSGPVDRGLWTCPRCGEPAENQFSACWQCGAEKPAQAGGDSSPSTA